MAGSGNGALAPTLSTEQFEYLRDSITGYCGFSLSGDYMSRLQRVVGLRMQAVGETDLAAYLQRLAQAPGQQGELSRLVDEVTNTETYFFREEFQLNALADHILPELVGLRERRRRLTLWSAGCSSGEEPFTLAMLLRSSPLWDRQLSRWEVRILGTDINRRMIRKAREGLYTESSFKGLEPGRCQALKSVFFEARGGRYAVNESLRSLVSFLHLNLLDRDGAGLFGEMDVILCRNVLMYFPAELRLLAVQSFYRKLAVGGYLLLGHSENLLGLETPFESCRLSDSLVYRKPARRGGRRDDGWGY